MIIGPTMQVHIISVLNSQVSILKVIERLIFNQDASISTMVEFYPQNYLQLLNFFLEKLSTLIQYHFIRAVLVNGMTVANEPPNHQAMCAICYFCAAFWLMQLLCMLCVPWSKMRKITFILMTLYFVSEIKSKHFKIHL